MHMHLKINPKTESFKTSTPLHDFLNGLMPEVTFTFKITAIVSPLSQRQIMLSSVIPFTWMISSVEELTLSLTENCCRSILSVRAWLSGSSDWLEGRKGHVSLAVLSQTED